MQGGLVDDVPTPPLAMEIGPAPELDAMATTAMPAYQMGAAFAMPPAMSAPPLLAPPPPTTGAPPAPPPQALHGTAAGWRLRTSDGEKGPLDLGEVKSLIRAGALVRQDEVILPGEVSWRPASEAAALQRWFQLRDQAAGGSAASGAPASKSLLASAPTDPRIKSAATAGYVVAGLTAIGAAILGGALLVDAVVLAGLSYGVSRRSRVCAVLLLLVYVAGRIVMMAQMGAGKGVLLTLLMTWYFIQGVAGTFAHHSAGAGGRSAGARA